jgi:hypothetical protein
MIEKRISRQVAEMAKEKGLDFDLDFGGNCGCYQINDTVEFEKDYVIPYHVHFQYPDRKEYLFAPTQGYFQKWLRDVHRVHVGIDYDSKGWGFFITNLNNPNGEINWSKNYETYEEALEAGFKTALRDYVK